MDFEIILLAFIPLLVAFDAVGIVPMYLGLTSGISDHEKKKLVLNATMTAFIICVLFLFIGNAVIKFLGITVNDFRIAGGLILLIISISDLLFYESRIRGVKQEDIGVVPIGIPLIAGPAVLTTILISRDAFGIYITVISLLINLIIMYLCLANAGFIKKIMGEAGSKAFAKVASLFLAAIAVMMIRTGLTNTIN
ncbi:MAG: MarC family protein [Ignavibacteria bacterium]|nr:MarC family protein [Ignavibacteria bacterium]MBK7160647.1 MarC family protein [Ignavibacteria bacterium]MBK7445764.1 MarC family protein [Ignavibacteria bacterium]MBK8382465.1 MarC family protein [Ignavibacteria bacterium]MBK9404322.1 MarC family protein [Ignavibacteria bacterium]